MAEYEVARGWRSAGHLAAATPRKWAAVRRMIQLAPPREAPDTACHQAAALSAAGDEAGFREFIDRYPPAL